MTVGTLGVVFSDDEFYTCENCEEALEPVENINRACEITGPKWTLPIVRAKVLR